LPFNPEPDNEGQQNFPDFAVHRAHEVQAAGNTYSICSEIGTKSDNVGVSVRIVHCNENNVMRILNEYLNYPLDFSPISI